MRFLLPILVLALLAGCGRHRTPVEKANAEGILLLGNGSDPKDLDPQITVGLVEFDVLTALFEGLTSTDPKTCAPRARCGRELDPQRRQHGLYF